MDLINKIRTLRESKGLTQEDLADKFGVTRSNYAYLEGRGSKLTIEQLDKIAGALGVSVVEMLTDDVAPVSEREKSLEKRVVELEQSLQEVRELKDYQLKSIESKNVALKLIDETIDMYYQLIQDSVLEEKEMPQNLAIIAYTQLNDLVKIVKLIIDAKDLKTMEESIRKFIQDDSYDWLKFLSIFDRKERKGGASYWDGKYMVSDTE